MCLLILTYGSDLVKVKGKKTKLYSGRRTYIMEDGMKIALGQLDMVWEDKDATLTKVEQMMATASQAGADLILFPEMTLTGFSTNLDRIGELPDDSWSVNQMRRLAVKYKLAAGFGWGALPEYAGGKGTNRFTLVSGTGAVLAEYKKLHPFRYGGEADVFEGGDRIVTVPFQGRTLGLFVCYDLRFPEIFQIASKRADVLLVIANWPSSLRDHWMTLLRARAIENQAYVAGVNCTGVRDGLEYSGDSMAVDALGNVLGILSWQEGVLLCEIDDRAWHLREKFQAKKDRREELYLSGYTNKDEVEFHG